MIAPMHFKRTIKRVSGWSERVMHKFMQNDAATRACIFYYHRISDPGFIDREFDDRNVPCKLFRKHIKALKEFTEIVPLSELPARLSEQSASAPGKPLVSITFDDGYSNFCQNALPVLIEYDVPVTLAVVTGYIESPKPASFDLWALRNRNRINPETWRILDWDELEQCLASGLVTLAGHSHLHLRGRRCSTWELESEAFESAEILRGRFGKQHARIYAYPYGNSALGDVSGSYVKAVKDAGYEMALTTEVGFMRPETDIFRLPRLEAHDIDNGATLHARASGVLAPLYAKKAFHKLKGWYGNNRKTSTSQGAGSGERQERLQY